MVGTDPAVIALKRQTQQIRDMVTATQSADLASRQLAAESARAALDSTFRLTSGEGLRNPIPGRLEDDTTGRTLIGRGVGTSARTSARAPTRSAANPYVASVETVPGAAPITASTVLNPVSRISPGKQAQLGMIE